MQAISQSMRLLWDALFLQPEPYATLRDDKRPFMRGLTILLILGLLLGLVGVIGATLEWASSPNLADLQATVEAELQNMPWWSDMAQVPEAMEAFQQVWDTIWRFVGFFAPSPATSLAGIITKPLTLILGWLVWGVVAHLLARLFGGDGNLGQTLGATALGAAPQLLTIATALPFVAVAGLGVWSLLCNYVALRTVHNLSWGRAAWAAFLPPVILGLIFGIIGGIVGAALLPTLINNLSAGGF